MVDGELAGQLDPGAPSPRARLALIREIADAGLAPHVMVAPVVPYLTDSTAQLDALLAGLAAAGAVSVSAIPMHLRPAPGWFLRWLADEHPALLRRYRALYGRVRTCPPSTPPDSQIGCGHWCPTMVWLVVPDPCPTLRRRWLRPWRPDLRRWRNRPSLGC